VEVPSLNQEQFALLCFSPAAQHDLGFKDLVSKRGKLRQGFPGLEKATFREPEVTAQ
jgi:hypothetical protein